MKERNIFNNWLELDCFCMDIAEAWIRYRQSKNKEVSSDEFMEWVMNELCIALESGFDDVYEEEFEDEEE
jgi:hypothetical protein